MVTSSLGIKTPTTLKLDYENDEKDGSFSNGTVPEFISVCVVYMRHD